MLYYSSPQILVEEIPDEITLGISISGCELHCEGCHSEETWDKTFGFPLTEKKISSFLLRKHLSCFLIYAGYHDEQELEKIFKFIKRNSKLKIAFYTGLEYEDISFKILKYLDYLKVGPYIEAYGGLKENTTNQKLFSIKNGKKDKELFLNQKEEEEYDN